MDYQTKPISRNDLRLLAQYIRSLFNINSSCRFPVLQILERLPDIEIFENVSVEIVEDSELPQNVAAESQPFDDNRFTIRIKQSVYDNAYYKNSGGCRMHILHEICHVFLYRIGFTPILTRCYKENELDPFCSVEWQAKALAGEIMMPYEATMGLDINEIISIYGVSQDAAITRTHY